jgi:hypothetical protein
VSTFNRSILVRAIGTSGIDGVSKTLKKRTDFLVVEKLSSLIEVNILARHGGGILLEPGFEPVERSTLGDTGCAVKG